MRSVLCSSFWVFELRSSLFPFSEAKTTHLFVSSRLVSTRLDSTRLKSRFIRFQSRTTYWFTFCMQFFRRQLPESTLVLRRLLQPKKQIEIFYCEKMTDNSPKLPIDEKGNFIRQQSSFRNWITRDGSSGFPSAADRYHLYVSYACPFASRAIIVRKLKGLEQAIGMTAVHPVLNRAIGWEFDDKVPRCERDPINGKKTLKEIYQMADAEYQGRITVPVLWDKEKKTIVNNESSDVIKMLNSEFNDFCETGEQTRLDLYPSENKDDIDRLIQCITDDVNEGVYKAGFATTQEAYESGANKVFETLDRLETLLGSSRFLTGTNLTLADIRLFCSLIRFDWVYHGLFKCNKKKLIEYPNLWAFTRDVYNIDDVGKETVDRYHIVNYYYRSMDMINPNRIVPIGPELDLSVPEEPKNGKIGYKPSDMEYKPLNPDIARIQSFNLPENVSCYHVQWAIGKLPLNGGAVVSEIFKAASVYVDGSSKLELEFRMDYSIDEAWNACKIGLYRMRVKENDPDVPIIVRLGILNDKLRFPIRLIDSATLNISTIRFITSWQTSDDETQTLIRQADTDGFVIHCWLDIPNDVIEFTQRPHDPQYPQTGPENYASALLSSTDADLFDEVVIVDNGGTKVSSDITLVTDQGEEDERRFRCHTDILKSRSPTFANLPFEEILDGDQFEEGKELIVKIKEIHGDAMYILLKYVYTGDYTNIPIDAIPQVVQLAEKCILPELRDECLLQLITNAYGEAIVVREGVWLDHLDLAEKFSIQYFKKICVLALSTNMRFFEDEQIRGKLRPESMTDLLRMVAQRDETTEVIKISTQE